MRYKIILEKDEEGGYSVYVPALKGCFTQGETFEEAIENAREAIEGFIETLKAHNQPIPKDEELVFTEVAVPMPSEYLLKANAQAVEANY